MKFLAKWNLTSKITLLITLAILVSMASVATVTLFTITGKIKADVINQQNTSIRVAAQILETTIGGVDITRDSTGNVNRVQMSSIPTFEDHSMIDTIGGVTSETATVFAWDDETQDFWRKTTNIIKADGKRAVGTPLGKKGAVYPIITKGSTFVGEAVILGIPYYTLYEPIFAQDNKQVIGILYVGIVKSRVDAILSDISSGLLIAITLVSAVLLILAFFICRSILRPIPVMTEILTTLANNENTEETPYGEQPNEIGDMARAIAILAQNNAKRKRLEQEKDATRKSDQERQTYVDSLISEFRSTITDGLENVIKNSSDMKSTADALSNISNATSEQAISASSASEEASTNVGTVAAAAEELSTSISEITRQVEQTNEIVQKATDTTEMTNQQIVSLADKSQKIGDVVSLIQDIAEQTNLLALNATIEAARAGEMGKGFAVVASEVKSLANQTAKATEEISAQVADIQASTSDAVKGIQEITEIMTEVNEFTDAIGSSVAEQNIATIEISDNVTQASNGTQEMASSMSNISASINQTSSSANDVAHASTEMNKQVDDLKTSVTEFLDKVAGA
ncbi:MAG: methyl-accepting chemotaxis protein [Hyphomicrobiales bacterium]|nr:MAG: methyl-accepting chemotaxis protein [Hyphomicrobiales bacterium]